MVRLRRVITGGRRTGPNEKHHTQADSRNTKGKKQEKPRRTVMKQNAVNLGPNGSTKPPITFQNPGDRASASREVSHVGHQNRGG